MFYSFINSIDVPEVLVQFTSAFLYLQLSFHAYLPAFSLQWNKVKNQLRCCLIKIEIV